MNWSLHLMREVGTLSGIRETSFYLPAHITLSDAIRVAETVEATLRDTPYPGYGFALDIWDDRSIEVARRQIASAAGVDPAEIPDSGQLEVRFATENSAS